jgi:type II secretory ATPase GspE/PulE/Tfp pilus assembly ATPase PilB-like protein
MVVMIGQLLLDKQLVTPEQLEICIQEKNRTGELLGKILVRKGFLKEEDLIKTLSEQLNIPYVELKNIKIDLAAVKKVPAKFALHYNIMPVRFEENRLVVASSDPFNSLSDLRLFLGCDLSPVIATEAGIMEAIKEYYGVGAETVEGIIAKTPKDSERIDISQQPEDIEDIQKLAEDASVIKLVNQIILEAHQRRATDIHIEPFRKKISIRYRVDGILYDVNVPSEIERFFPAIISRMKIMSQLNIVEKRLPQDGRAAVKVGNESLDLRISIIPTRHGESIVIRILPTSMLLSLESLGLNPAELNILRSLIKKPHGIILVTGPTGSGKTTTLYASLSEIKSSENKILTIEDPIEYEIEGISQIQVIPKIGFTFAQGLRSILRHDPDILMVGEIRDFETAELAIRSALTGHLIFSTLHTNDAPGGVARLLNIGIEPYLVASSLAAFIAQRLVRIICPECKRLDEDMPKDMISSIIKEISASKTGLSHIKAEDVKIYRGKGCKSCNFTGFKGRTAIYEILVVDKAMRELILKKESTERIRDKMISQGMNTLRLSGWQKVLEGITTPDEIIRVTQAVE